MTALIEISGLTKVFTIHALGRTVTALDSIELTLKEGMHTVLVGRSGSGKSTLIKCINRSNVVDQGRIVYRTATGDQVDIGTIADRSMADLRDSEIGYVSQFLRAEPRRTAVQVVAGRAMRHGLEKQEAYEEAGRVLGEVGLTDDLWGSFPALMSGGEQQRVNLAAASVVAPRLLLLDEPVASLDPGTAAKALGVIQRLRSMGTTVLSVFHERAVAERLADEVAVLEGGRLVDQGSPTAVRWPGAT